MQLPQEHQCLCAKALHRIRTVNSSELFCSRQSSHLLPLFRILAGADCCCVGNNVLVLLQFVTQLNIGSRPWPLKLLYNLQPASLSLQLHLMKLQPERRCDHRGSPRFHCVKRLFQCRNRLFCRATGRRGRCACRRKLYSLETGRRP